MQTLQTFSKKEQPSVAELVGEILDKQRVEPYFQPLISVKNLSLIGLEALARGRTQLGELVPPLVLFEEAARLGRSIETDRLCRDQALTAFGKVQESYPELFLFLNFDATLIDQGVVGSDYLKQSVEKRGLRPRTIVVEISESKVQDIGMLKAFIEKYRGYGFLFALDDIGIGHSNLDRLLLTKPDILKIDRCLITDIHLDCYKQEVFSSIVNISKKVGALVVAEGIETEEEALLCCDLGADFLQGYYFSKPQPYHGSLNVFKGVKEAAEQLRRHFKQYKVDKIQAAVNRNQFYKAVAEKMTLELSETLPETFDEKLMEAARYPQLEYVYLLDEKGLQISNSVCDSCAFSRPQKKLFQAAQKGADQSLKNYYLYVHAGLEQYISEPYISCATGSLCITVSRKFRAADGCCYILCADFTV